jgi:hypothetical protein
MTQKVAKGGGPQTSNVTGAYKSLAVSNYIPLSHTLNIRAFSSNNSKESKISARRWREKAYFEAKFEDRICFNFVSEL